MTDNKELSQLELEFEKTVNANEERIHAAELALRKAMDDLIDILEETGIPRYVCPSDVGQVYTPSSFADKFSELDSEFVCDLTDTFDNEYAGWQASQIC